MKDLVFLLIHLLTTLAKLLGPGSAKSIVADSLLTPAEAAGGASKSPIKLDNFHWQTHCKGLYQLPIAA